MTVDHDTPPQQVTQGSSAADDRLPAGSSAKTNVIQKGTGRQSPLAGQAGMCPSPAGPMPP